MKNLIKYVCIAMIVLAVFGGFFEGYLLLRSSTGAPAQFTISFVNHILMLVAGIMGLKFRDDDERQKMLAGISGMQTIFCLLSVFVDRYSILIAIKTLGIGDWLSIICSVVLLVYYVQGMIRVKKKRQQDESVTNSAID